MFVFESYSLIHDVANRSHNVAFACRARTRSSFIGVEISTSNLRLQPQLTDRRILRSHSTCPVELSLFPLDQRRYSMRNGRLITCRCPSEQSSSRRCQRHKNSVPENRSTDNRRSILMVDDCGACRLDARKRSDSNGRYKSPPYAVPC